MKLPNTKIESVVSDDKSREVITHVYLDAEGKRLVACNGFVLAVNPVEVEDRDTSGLISVDAIKLARKTAPKRVEPHVLANGDLRVPLASATLDRPEGKYPDFNQVIPVVNTENTSPTLVIDAKLLYELSKALCEDGNRVALWVNPVTTGPIYVKPTGQFMKESGNYGVIMPVHHGNR